ncbi:MAG: hypothetical protein ABIQ15_01965 [Nocardioides sp.]
MSKMDNQRAMREAKFARTQARAKAQPARATAPPPVAPPTTAEAPPTAPSVGEAPLGATEGLCGHRSMNGRTCTRESGHAAKSHRYS